MNEYKVSWAVLTRQFISFQRTDYLSRAIIEADKIGEAEIISILQSVSNRKVNDSIVLIQQSLPRLNVENRLEEYYTLILLYLMFQSINTEQYKYYPPDQQGSVFQSGINACDKAVEISKALEDLPCEAKFISTAAYSYQSIGRLNASKQYYLKSLRIYTKLVNIHLDDFDQLLFSEHYKLATVNRDLLQLDLTTTPLNEGISEFSKIHNQTKLNTELKILLSVTTKEELVNLIKKSPFLLEKATLLYLIKQELFLRLNNLSIAENQKQVILILLMIKQSFGKPDQRIVLRQITTFLSQVNQANSKSQPVKSKIKWAKLLRDFITLQDRNIFLEAINELQQLGEEKIVEILKKAMIYNLEALKMLPQFMERLSLEGRYEESQTLLLFSHTLRIAFLGTDLVDQNSVAQTIIDFCEDAIVTSDTIEDQGCKSFFLYQKASIYHQEKRLNEAKLAFNETLKIRRDLAINSQSFYPLLINTLNGLGNVIYDLGNYKGAEKYFLKAHDIYINLSESQKHKFDISFALTLSNLGTAQSELNKNEDAKHSFEKALKIYDKTLTKDYGAEREIAMIYQNLGNAEYQLGNFKRALSFFRKALKTRRRLAIDKPQIYYKDVSITLTNIGYVKINQKKYATALSYFEEARKLNEKLIDNLTDITRRKSVFQETIGAYKGMIFCLIKLGRWNKALEIAEQGKSRSVSDLLNLKIIRPKNPNNSPELNTLADQYEQLMKEAHQLETTLISNDKDKGKIQRYKDDSGSDEKLRYENQMTIINQSLENIIDKQRKNVIAKNLILAKIRRYDENFPPQTKLLKQTEIYTLSKESGKTIVLFRVTDKGTFVFIVYPDGTLEHLEKEAFTFVRLRELTTKWLTPYFAYLQNELMTDFDAFKEGMNPILKDIYDELLKDVHQKLKDKKVKDVLFVPSGDLAVFPLHACCWVKDGNLNYLIDDDLTISYATSVSVFKRAWELEHKRQDSFLFITNPDKSLKDSDLEVDEIKATFDITVKDLRHEEATKQTVKAEIRKGYGFYHFSCHGNYDRQNPFDSSLKLAIEDLTVVEREGLSDEEIEQSKEEKRSFTMKEIMETSLGNAWLTTLSACETGVVNFEETSDEHYGLPLAFVFAGCPSIWGTLWSVRDDATSELMKFAYQNIKDGKEKSEALRLAQIELKKNPQYESPYYWAGFQHFGV